MGNSSQGIGCNDIGSEKNLLSGDGNSFETENEQCSEKKGLWKTQI